MKFLKYFNYPFCCIVKTFQVCTIREWLTQPRPLPLSLPSNAKPTPDLYWHSSPPLPFWLQVTLGVTAVVEPPGLVIAGVADIAWWDANFCLAPRALCESDRDSSRRFTFPLRRLAAVLPPSEWGKSPDARSRRQDVTAQSRCAAALLPNAMGVYNDNTRQLTRTCRNCDRVPYQFPWQQLKITDPFLNRIGSIVQGPFEVPRCSFSSKL